MSQLQVTGEAKIRDLQGPLVADSGVISALDGDASQYVRGDGTLADFPTSSGGGSSVSYYLNSSVSQGTIGGVAYRELSKEPIIGAGTDIAISSNGYVASYLTDANDPDVVLIPGGNFNCEFYFSVNNNTGNPFFYAELYKYDGTTFTLLGSSVGVPEYITQGTTIAPYYFAIPVATATLALTDRLAIRIYVNVGGRTVTLHTENGHLCQVVTTLSKGMVSLNNLTDQSQFLTTGTSGTNFAIVSSGDTHTFNLPIASATNTGKLSSTDWSTFNNKQAALSFTAPLDNTSNTISIPAATSLVDGYLDNADWTNFNTAYNNMIVSAAVTGTTTKTLTLTQQDAGTITASWTDDNTDAVTSVFGRTGAVVATSGDYNTSQVTELTNLYFTDARSRAALSFTAGSGAYNSTTGVITIPTNTNQLTNGASFITLASLSAGTGITYNNTTGVITNSAPDQTVSLTQGAGISISGTYPSFTIASTITQYTDALARAAISLTTTGTSGAATYNATTGVFNIPQYQSVLTNPVTGTGLLNRVAKFNSNGSTITYGLISDDGVSVETNAYTYITKTLIPRQATSYATNFKSLINATAGWIYLGNLTIPQQGYNACITMDAGLGFNASLGQMGYLKLHIRTSNNSSSGGFYFTAFAEQFGYANFIQEIRITENILTNTLGIYVYSNTFIGLGYYKVEGSGIEYIPVETATAPPSTYYQVALAFTVNSSTTFNNTVGIGSLSANAPLDVTSSTSGSSSIQQWSYNSAPSSYRLQLNTIVSSGLVKYSFDMLNAGAAYNNNLVLDTGKVGIGTATPIYTLDVVKAGANGLRVLNTDTGSDAAFVIVQNLTTAGLFGVNNAGPYLYTASALDMQFYTSAIERMRIFSDGNILIGSSTTNAGYKLDVSGTGRFSGILTVNSGASATTTNFTNNGDFISNWIGNSTVQLFSIRNNSTTGVFLNTQNSAPLRLGVSTGTTGGTVVNHFEIASSGAATFSSSVTASGDITSRTSLNAYTLSNVEPYIFLARNSGSNGIGVIRTLDGGALAFDNGATGAAQSTKMTLSASGNLGLGVTPSAWWSGFKAIQFGTTGILASGSGVTNFGHNYYFDGTNVIYLTSSNASFYQQTTGQHLWYTAPSGTAGNVISFTQAMTLDANGRLFLGATSGTGSERMLIATNSSGAFTQGLNIRDDNAAANGNNFVVFRRSDDTYLGTINRSGTSNALSINGNDHLAFAVGFTERMRITSGGNVLVGTTTDAGYKLDVNGTLRAVGTINSNQGYTYPNGIINVTGGSASWIFLGTISIAQGGNTAVITLEGGSGYNADEGQNGSARIFIRTSNGSPNGSGFYFSATLTQMGYNTGVVSSCIMTQTNATTYNVYVNFGAYSGNTYYKVEGSAFTWTASNTDFGATAPTGGQTLTSIFKVISTATFANNVSIGGAVSGGGALQVNGNVNINGVFQINGVTIGGGGGSGVTGAGTTNYISKWTGSTSLGNSVIFDNGTNVGIGGSTFTYASSGRTNLVINGSTDSLLEFQNAGSSSGYIFSNSSNLELNAIGARFMQFVANGEIRMKIFANGNVGINRITDAGYTFDVNGTGRFTGQLTGTDALFAGSVTASGGFFDTSDSRLKILVKDYEQPKGIENVVARMYVKNSKQELGYYAQDLQEILPSAVGEGSDGFLTLSYSQVHTAKIAHLEKEVAELKELIKSLIK
jgi:hypothetical protein